MQRANSQDNVSRVRQGNLTLAKRDTDSDSYWAGYATTPHGMVGVCQQVSNSRDQNANPGQGYTELIFQLGGQSFTRTFFAFYSDRYTLTLAVRFAEEIETHKGFKP